MPKERQTKSDLERVHKLTPNSRDIHKIKSLWLDINADSLDVPERVISTEEFERYLKTIIDSQLYEFDRKKRNPYHNADHAKEVVERARALLKQCAGLAESDKQIVLLGAAFHDYGHVGKTIRQAEDGLSNEEFATTQADKFAKHIRLSRVRFSVSQRIKLYGLIIGTTFGNSAIRPETRIEKVLAIADLGGFIKSWDEWVKESVDVMQEESEIYRPATVQSWLSSSAKFLDYVAGRLKQVPEAEALWGRALQEKIGIVRELLANPTGPNMDAITKHVLPHLRK